MPLPGHLQPTLLEIVSRLISFSSHSQPKRVYSTLFQDPPDRKLYPDYYVLITEPMSLNGVLSSLNKGNYSSPQAVAYDLFLVWSNAKTYNQEGSQVYADAEKLETCMQDLWNGRSPPLPSWDSLPRPGFLKKSKKSSKGTLGEGDSKSKEQHRAEKKERHRLKHLKAAAKLEKAAAAAVVEAPAPAPVATSGGSNGFKLKIQPKLPLTPSVSQSSVAASGSTPQAPASRGQPVPTTIDTALIFAAPSSYTPVASTSAVQSHLPLSTTSQLYHAAALTAAPPPTPTTTQPIESKKAKQQREREARVADAAAIVAAAGPVVSTSTSKGKSSSSLKLSQPVAEEDVPEIILPTVEKDLSSGWMSDNGVDKQKMFKWVAKELREYRNADGRLLSTPLYSLPDRATRGDYYQAVPDPIALDTVDERITSHYYQSTEAFDRDLHHLFEVAKMFIAPLSPGTVWPDLLLVQRRYYELTKPGSSPESLAAYVSGDKLSSEPHERVQLDGVNFKGEVYNIGDWLHLMNPDDPAKPHVGQIFKIFKKIGTSQRFFDVCWYYRPEETIHPVNRLFYDNEVFRASRFQVYPVEDLMERCCVMFYHRYIHGRPLPPLWTAEMPLYVCESRYKPVEKTFKKIKAWDSCLPDSMKGVVYPFKENDGGKVLIPTKVKSPFVLHEEARRAAAMSSKRAPLAPTHSVATKGATSNGNRGTSAQATQQSNAPGPTPLEIVDASLTPSQRSVTTQKFDTLPIAIQRKFQCDPTTGESLWFSAPPSLHEEESSNKRRKLTGHSFEYIMWKAQKLVERMRATTIGNGDGDEDVVMT